MTKDELFERISHVLRDAFEIEPAQITSDAKLSADLDIDSVDAVDLSGQFKALWGGRLQQESFKSVRNVVGVLHGLICEPA